MSSRVRLLTIGDSITVGYLAVPGFRSPLWALLRGALGNLINCGDDDGGGMGPARMCGGSGFTTDTILTRVLVQAPAWYPDLVTIHAGTNDATQRASGSGTPPTRAESVVNVVAMIAACRAANPRSRVLVVTALVPNTNAAADAELLAYGLALDAAVRLCPHYLAGRVGLVDVRSAFLAIEGWETVLLGDVTHPNLLGYNVIADALYAARGIVYSGGRR